MIDAKITLIMAMHNMLITFFIDEILEFVIYLLQRYIKYFDIANILLFFDIFMLCECLRMMRRKAKKGLSEKK